MTRTDNVKKNLIFNIVKFTTQMVLQFVLRTVLIYIMGAEYLGLNGLFTNIFAFLNLAELGIGSAIGFSMYKPIVDGDIETIKSLQAMHKKFYVVIAGIVALLGLGLMPFLKFFINGEVTVGINIYVLFGLYLINTLVGYFSAHKRSLLFAYQRNDVENKIKTVCLIFMTILQIVIIVLVKNYYAYFIVNIIFTLIECVLVNVWADKLFPNIKGKAQPLDKDIKKQITKNIAALSFHKIGGTIIYSTDNILISSLLGIVVLGAYSNYYLVVTTLISVFALLSNAITSSVGNMIASESKEYVYAKFKQINFIYTIMSAFCTVCMFVLFQPFMILWTGGGIYLLDISTVILMCVSFYIVRMRTAVNIFKDAAGLFWQSRFVPAFEATLNIVISIVLGIFMGINGIILGTIISAILVPLIFEPRVLYKHYFQKNVSKYLLKFAVDAVIMAVTAFICYFVCSFIPDGGIWLFVVKFVSCIILAFILLLLFYFKTKDFKSCVQWLKDVIRNLKDKKVINKKTSIKK